MYWEIWVSDIMRNVIFVFVKNKLWLWFIIIEGYGIKLIKGKGRWGEV